MTRKIFVIFFAFLLVETPSSNSLLVAQGVALAGQPILHENSGTGATNFTGELAFTNITVASGIVGAGAGGHGAAFADVDRDGLRSDPSVL